MKQKPVKLGAVGMNRGRTVVSRILGDDSVILRAICDKNPQRLTEAKTYF